MFSKFFLYLFLIFFIYSSNLYSDEKQLIIKRLLEINNFTFNFEQIAQGKIEKGNCLLVFDNKLKCKYFNKKQKEIIINNKTLVVIQKKYDKIYYYPLSKSPFVKILNKSSLINLVKESNLELNDNIDLINVDDKGIKITISFHKKNYELIGWKIVDQFQNEIFFSLKIQDVNIKVKNNFFKIPPVS